MTTDPGSSPEPTNTGSKFKLTLIQGVIGAVSLAGTTAIPIVVQRVLSSAPVASPSPTASVEVAPAQVQPIASPTVQPIASPTVQPIANPTVQPEVQGEMKGADEEKGEGKKKGKKKKD
jgi:hypothetical protein